MKMRLGLAALLAMTAGAAAANPLKMEYCVTPGGLGFNYKITLTLDNHDNSWVAGQGWGWIIIGDIEGGANPVFSPINDYVADPSYWPAGPFNSMTGSGGGHNGPTLGPIIVEDPNHPDPEDPLHWLWVTWVPTAVGDSITWGGSSATDLAQGQFLWSNMVVSGGAPNVFFEVANRITCGGPTPCYANCDASTAPPTLNANDFQCFLNEFAAGTTYANCDHSTAEPVLNANDFQCFLNEFAAGCT